MIFGVGTDMIDRGRFVHKADRLALKILTEKEYANYKQAKNKYDFMAKTWAVKEAVSKAWGSGIGRTCGWKDMELARNSNGQPYVNFNGQLASRATTLNITCHISITDQYEYVLAFAVLAYNK
jgi:holo-[acyl-carrier protein] synthase